MVLKIKATREQQDRKQTRRRTAPNSLPIRSFRFRGRGGSTKSLQEAEPYSWNRNPSPTGSCPGCLISSRGCYFSGGSGNVRMWGLSEEVGQRAHLWSSTPGPSPFFSLSGLSTMRWAFFSSALPHCHCGPRIGAKERLKFPKL